jgi:hypothetical protein
MTRPRFSGLTLGLFILGGLSLLAVLLGGGQPASFAQGSYVIPTPTATAIPPANPVATAQASLFTLEEASLISNYPTGVTFRVRVASSAAEIESIRVRIWTRDSTPESAPLTWDEAAQAYTYFDRLFEPPWFEISYSFRIRDRAGNILETETFTSEYADETRTWTRRENDDVIVLITGGGKGLADDLFASSSNAIRRLEDAFGISLDYNPYVVVMDQASFEEWQEHLDPSLAGLTYGTRGYTVQTLTFGQSELVDATVPHELTHIFQGFIEEARDIPGWFTEDNATYFEPVPQYNYEARVRAMVNMPGFPTLADNFDPGRNGPDGRNRLGYDMGYTFIKYWIDNYGWESHRVFWQAQVKLDFEEALQLATGQTLAGLETEWRRWLGATGAAPTLIPTPTFPPFPTARPMPTLPGSGS